MTLVDSLKPLSELTDPDPRSQGYGFFGTPATFRPKTIEDHYAQLSTLTLHSTVPDDVKQHFEIARMIYMYSWYAHRLTHVADLHAMGSLELALRVRQGPDSKVRYIGPLLRAAIRDGLLHDMRMGAWQRREQATKRALQEESQWPEDFQRLFGRRTSHAPASDGQEFVKRLATMLPKYRNELAHGSWLLYPQGIDVLELCADLINQLWPAEQPI